MEAGYDVNTFTEYLNTIKTGQDALNIMGWSLEELKVIV
jgi:hypothetical protein